MFASVLFGILSALPLIQSGQDPQVLLRENRLDEARSAFEKLLAKSPKDVDALVGAGYTALRQNSVDEALAFFHRALKLAPKYADISYGLALCHWRKGDVEAARRHVQDALRLSPKHQEARELLERMPEAEEAATAPVAPTSLAKLAPKKKKADTLQVPFRVTPKGFQVGEGDSWRTVYLKGVNLGSALPGRFATEFPSRKVYQDWLKDMGDLGVNVLRVYTIHPPVFYEALREYNLSAKKPIYIIHGLWAEQPPQYEFEDPVWFGEWKRDMRRLVDILHGHASFPSRPGYTGGTYRADVSKWWLGTILGREWEPFDVVHYNKLHPGVSDWKGRFVEVKQAHATEVFMAKAMDIFIGMEHDTYHAQRPLAFSNWPTLDPISHPTETPYMEEQHLRKKLGLPYSLETKTEVYDDDSVAVDMEKYDSLDSFHAGLFVSYHIYPNFPEFINLDPVYSRAKDHEGPNNYYGYLVDIRNWHKKHAVLVSEYGMSNSRIPAHWQPQGLLHGGLDEKDQARMLARLTRNIYDAGFAGSVTFAWIDEWFKKTWQVAPIELPLERKPLWFNPMSAEENYGIIGHRPGTAGPNILIDGKLGDWEKVPSYQSDGNIELKLLADEGWLHAAVFWKGARPDWERERFVLGLDTLDPALGNHQLPFGVPLRSEGGMEFAVDLSGNGCEVYVDAPYDYSPHRRRRPIRTIAHEDGPWTQMQTETNRLRVGRDGTIFPFRQYDIGTLKEGTQDRQDPAFDSNAEWKEGEGFLEVRIPWSLIQVTDPSSLHVLQDPPEPVRDSDYGMSKTAGIRACLVRLSQPEWGKFRATAVLPGTEKGQIVTPPLFTWAPWQQPKWHAYRKLAFDALKQALESLPDVPGQAPTLKEVAPDEPKSPAMPEKTN